MNTLKLLVLETHQKKLKNGKFSTSGVDYARNILPATFLKDHFKVEIRKDPFTKKEKNWDELTKKWDIIFSSYIDEPIGYVQMAFWAERNNCTVVIDIDDDVWRLPKTNPVYEHYHPGSEKLTILTSILEHVPYVTTTNAYLQNRVIQECKRNHRNTIVLPNMIDLSSYDYTKIPEVKRENLVITHFGSTTHFQDLMEQGFVSALQRIMQKYPQVELRTVGNWIPQFTTLFGKRYRQIMGKPDVYEWMSDVWPSMMAQTDIFVAPLADIPSNRSKSDIKLLEAGAGKKPIVCSRMRPYNDTVGITESIAYLAGNEKEWFEKLEKLVTSEQLRKERGEELYKYVSENRTMQGNVGRWKEFFERVHSIF